MAPKVSKTAPEPTLYDILSITPKNLEGQAGPAIQKAVKQAYHKALLKHHPDKNQPVSSDSSPAQPESQSRVASSSSSSTSKSKSSKINSSSTSSSSTTTTKTSSRRSQAHLSYSVDQIQHAYGVLSDAKQRSAYDRTLRVEKKTASQRFHTGVETVDLDDVGFDERTGVYHRGCRCGNDRGYAFTEDDLEAFEDDGVLQVGCRDCSLWLRVLFTAAVDEDEDSAVAGGGGGKQQKKDGGKDQEVGRRGSNSAGEAKGSGWKFNWSFNLGLGLSGSATASANASGSGK
ncbi:hypothetical protein GGR56DRAFT_226337 [Xylariaceae sp. FL0804]|nr:hypothetical protein GGR56DRAFT_226337 [Xylariaceae sp. FL0804]